MAEEFEESEVIWPEFSQNAPNDNINYFNHRNILDPDQQNSRIAFNSKPKKKKKMMMTKTAMNHSNSAPVKIPENIFHYTDSEEFEDDYDDDDGEMVPPHVIIARRVAGKTAFSVCTGNGRTLKGRDLCQVRNSILRMTGFLET